MLWPNVGECYINFTDIYVRTYDLITLVFLFFLQDNLEIWLCMFNFHFEVRDFEMSRSFNTQ